MRISTRSAQGSSSGANVAAKEPQCRMARLMALAMVTLLAGGSALSSAAAEPTRPAVVAPDGAWCWFGNPRSILKGGILYASYVRSGDGRTAMSAYDPKSGVSNTLWISSFVSHDDHNNAGLLELSDGRMLAIYARHHSEKKFYYRLSKSSQPVTAEQWGPELVYSDVDSNITYANPYQLKSESGRVYNFLRCLNFNPTFVTSDDAGEHWSGAKIFIKVGTGVRPYVQYCSDYDRRIDYLYTDGHPDTVKTSLFHGYYQEGSYYRSDGSFLRKLADAPLLHDAPKNEHGPAIYQYSEKPSSDYNEHIPFGRTFTWDIAYDKDKSPASVFSVNTFEPGKAVNWGDRRLYYYYARWNGKGWTKRFIAQAGSPLYEDAYYYPAGITVDPSNPDVVYLSSNAADPFSLKEIENVPLQADKRYEIYRGVTADGGRSFTWQPVTSHSEADNLRPYVPRGNTYPYGLTWFAGRYRTYGSWDASILGYFSQTLEPFATAVPPPSAKARPTKP